MLRLAATSAELLAKHLFRRLLQRRHRMKVRAGAVADMRHTSRLQISFYNSFGTTMTFFTIAAIQMPVDSTHENISTMVKHVDALMLRFPSVRMVIFSELAAYGASKAHAEESGGGRDSVQRTCEAT